MDPSNHHLAPENAAGDGIGTRWAADNQQWWDWYMSLAVNEADPGPLRPAPPLPTLEPTQNDLEASYALSASAQAAFRRDGFVKLPAVLAPDGLLELRRELSDLLAEEVPGAASLGFASLELVWQHHARTRAYVLSRRLARIAAELLGVDAVRLYHDNVLSKNPGCGRTPWHYDAHHYPIDSAQVVTAWFPLQAVPADMGTLVFARTVELYREVASLPFDKHGDRYDRAIMDLVERRDVDLDVSGYALGDVSFHHAHCLHAAAPNRRDQSRLAVATTYFVDGARLVATPTMISGDFEKFMPGVKPGELIASPLNPVVYAAGLS